MIGNILQNKLTAEDKITEYMMAMKMPLGTKQDIYKDIKTSDQDTCKAIRNIN